MELNITLPYKYSPRSYQRDVFTAYAEGYRRFVSVWHRRSGKDKTWLNFMIVRMLERVGTYWYVLPTYAQAKKIIWQGMGSGVDEGMPFIDHFPNELIETKNETDMTIKLINGSMFYLIGSEKIDTVVGSNPVGIVYSEFSLQTKAAWDFVSPMLSENNGWAAFIFTPRGRDHACELYEKASASKTWFTSHKTIDDTRRDAAGEDGSKVISDAALQEERDRGMEEAMIQQEYYCSFAGYREGSYYGGLMAMAIQENRIRDIPWHPRFPVFTVWDLGIADQCAIWFAQVEGRDVYLINYYQKENESLSHFIAYCKNQPYVYSSHWAPHDIDQRMDTVASGLKTRRQMAAELGFNFRLAAKMPLMDGIEQVRQLIPRCFFDKVKCDAGIRALINYHREFNNKTQDYRDYPVHDIWSHGADAFRKLAQIIDIEKETQLFDKPVVYQRDFDIFESRPESVFDKPPDEVQLVTQDNLWNRYGITGGRN